MGCKTAENIKMLDVVKTLMDREGNITGMGMGRYMSAGKDVYTEMNLFTIRDTRRVFIKVDKSTNTISMPDDFLFLSSLSVVDPYCGEIIPLMINTTILNDIIDLNVDRSCDCECGCNSGICGNIFKYEKIERQVTVPMPTGPDEVFTSTIRKRIDAKGVIIQEVCEPVLKYDEDGVHTDTVMECKELELCTLDLKDCGCVIESESNIKKFSDSCCGGNYETECGTICCPKDNPYGYNFVEGSSRIAFASNFKFTEVLVRYYADAKTKDIKIPLIAKEAMIAGIMAKLLPHGKREPLYRINYWKNEYEVQKTILDTLINRYNLAEFYRTLFNPNRR